MVVIVAKNAIADDHQIDLFHGFVAHLADFIGSEQFGEGGRAAVWFDPLEPVWFGVKEFLGKCQVLKHDAVVSALQYLCVAQRDEGKDFSGGAGAEGGVVFVY